ncbi:MAG: hypothetical protein OXI15_07285 [Chromatiales bacterium]|nr:hypothetical protein [Chromatiales bacterium]
MVEPSERNFKEERDRECALAERGPWLLTPGPLTTSPEVKEAARHDYGLAITQVIYDQIESIVTGDSDDMAALQEEMVEEVSSMLP